MQGGISDGRDQKRESSPEMRNTEAGEMDKATNFMITPTVNRRGAGVSGKVSHGEKNEQVGNKSWEKLAAMAAVEF